MNASYANCSGAVSGKRQESPPKKSQSFADIRPKPSPNPTARSLMKAEARGCRGRGNPAGKVPECSPNASAPVQYPESATHWDASTRLIQGSLRPRLRPPNGKLPFPAHQPREGGKHRTEDLKSDEEKADRAGDVHRPVGVEVRTENTDGPTGWPEYIGVPTEWHGADTQCQINVYRGEALLQALSSKKGSQE